MTSQEIIQKGREEFGDIFTDVAAWLCEQLQDVYGDEISDVLSDLIEDQYRKH